jgi:hypothetical protein
MMHLMTRAAVMACDTRPEDVDAAMINGNPAPFDMNARIRQAAGRAPLPQGNGASPSGATHARLTEAVQIAEGGDPRGAISFLLERDLPSVMDVQFARALLAGLGAAPIEGEGYGPVAGLLSLSRVPDPAIIDSVVLTLLEIDGPGDATLAGQLLAAEGDDELHAVVNVLRQRAGLPPMVWDSAETTLVWPDEVVDPEQGTAAVRLA